MLLRKTCRCGEPKDRWRVRGAECRERIRLGYRVRPPGFWAKYRDPALHRRTTGLIALRGAPVSLTEVALQDPDNPVRDAIGQLHLEYMQGRGSKVAEQLNRHAPPGFPLTFDGSALTEAALRDTEHPQEITRWVEERLTCAPWPGYPTKPYPPR